MRRNYRPRPNKCPICTRFYSYRKGCSNCGYMGHNDGVIRESKISGRFIDAFEGRNIDD